MECKFILIVNAQAFSSWITFFGQMIISLFLCQNKLIIFVWITFSIKSSPSFWLWPKKMYSLFVVICVRFLMQSLKIHIYVHIDIPPLILNLRIPKSNLYIETSNNICNVRLPNSIHYVIMSSAVHLVFLSFESVRKAWVE